MDHCRHTTFNTELTDIYFEESVYGDLTKEAFKEYMEMRKTVYGDRKKIFALWIWLALERNTLKKKVRLMTWMSPKKLMLVQLKLRQNKW